MTLKRFVTTTAIAAALVLPGTIVFAQPGAAPTPSAPPAATAPQAAAPAPTQTSRHMRDDQLRASKLLGSSVYDANDQKIGSIEELVVNPDGKIADVVIGVGSYLGGGEKRVAVTMADLKRGKDNHLVFNTTKDALKQMAGYDFKAADTHSGSTLSR
jgi:sporulation protein YlmC with PRC-barrel domain